MTKRLVVTAAARDDLRVIGRTTAETWGLDQRARYLARIRERFIQLRNTPGLGHARDDIRPSYRSIPIGRHVVFYREAGDLIEIIRVLHDRMDLRRHLADL